MDMHLADKVAVVTGGSKGIGLAVGQALAALGAHVVAGARHNSAGLAALEAAGSATFVEADLAGPDGPHALVAEAERRGGVEEFGPKGVRVNTISPGPVATDLWLGDEGIAAQVSAAGGGAPDDVAKAAVAGSATGRFTTPQEVADLAVFLASDRAANITGSDVRIDGGYVTTL